MNLKIFRFLLSIGSVILFSACGNLPYYAQAVGGHFTVMHRAQPIDSVLTDPEIDPKVKQALNKIVQIREFASRELKLPDNLSYTSYADLERPFVVWNVFAAPEFSMKLKRWCFLQVGCVSYRGFFSQENAERYAEELRKEGYDVHVGGVRAYSTLGWFSDPVLNTFISYSESNLARLIFHELAHQVVYVAGDSMFNESFATAVEQEGIKRWFASHASDSVLSREGLNERLEREKKFVNLIGKYRDLLHALYLLDVDETEKRSQKVQIIEALRAEFAEMKASVPEFQSYENWFAQKLNNALLATVSLYTHSVPAFQFMLLQNDHDMGKFYDAVKRVSKLPKAERDIILHQARESYFLVEGIQP